MRIGSPGSSSGKSFHIHPGGAGVAPGGDAGVRVGPVGVGHGEGGGGNGLAVGGLGVEGGVGLPGVGVFFGDSSSGVGDGGCGRGSPPQLVSIPPTANSSSTTANACTHLRRLRSRCAATLKIANGPNSDAETWNGMYGFAPPPGVRYRPVTGS